VADEILTSTIADLTLSETLSGLVVQLLADRNGLPAHPALIELPDLAALGSKTVKISEIGLMGYDLLTSQTEGSAMANTALTDGSVTVATGPYGKSYEHSDLAGIIDSQGQINARMLALDAVVSVGATLLSLIANLVDNFSNTTGASGVDATFANFLDQITALEIAKVEGPYLAIYHPVQWGDIRKDVATQSGGAIQWNQGSQEILNRSKGLGYKGKFCDVDVWTTTYVTNANAGADRAGGMFGRGALAWGMASVAANPAIPMQMNLGPKILFEASRSAKAGLTAYVTHMYPAAVEVLDAAGNSLITDA